MNKYLEMLRLMTHVNHKFKNIMREKTKEIGFPDSFRPFIYHVCRNEGLSQNELVNLLGFKAPTVSLTLDKLEHQGFISRQVDNDDQRIMRIQPTKKSIHADEEFTQVAIKTSEELLGNLTDEEIIASKKILLKLKKELDKNENI